MTDLGERRPLLPPGALDGAPRPRRALGRPALRPAGAADRGAGTAHLHRHDALAPAPATGPSSGSPARRRSRRRSSSARREEADEALAKVHRLHETVEGTLPEAAGAHPAGAAYSAFDPELMLWTLAVIADSGRAMYETMVRPLSEGEREDLWQDYVRFGELFGLPRSEVPASHLEFQRLVGREARLTRPAGDRARAGDGAAGRLPPAGAGRRPGQHRGPEPHHQGNAAAAGARDLRHPLERRARGELPRRSPPRTAVRAAFSPVRCGAAATTSSSTW